MDSFQKALGASNHSFQGRTAVLVLADQLNDQVGPVAKIPARKLGIVMVEDHAALRRRPYHRQKVATVIANMRQFALEQARRGVAVHYVVETRCEADAVTAAAKKLGPLVAMEPLGREQRKSLEPVVERNLLSYVNNETVMTSRALFDESQRGKTFRMDAFYRRVRQHTGVLMQKGKPVGGKLSFDTENRQRWNGSPVAPIVPVFVHDHVTSEVFELVETQFAKHPGRLAPELLTATAAQAEQLWQWAKTNCLPNFGPYEDAMSTTSRRLFHSGISTVLNLSRLLPQQLVFDAENADASLPSREGFIRQILGWREFVRHVHQVTDGFRNMSGVSSEVMAQVGDGGFERWAGRPWKSTSPLVSDGGAVPSELNATTPLPPAFWGTPSGLNCLDTVVQSVWDEGYSHHITRLMVLSNIATLLGISPRELTDWFWVAYTDAYDWVVEPNVLAMGSFAVGDLMTTKPYVSGAAYISKMSDACKSCRFDPKKNCPITRWYWAFLARHAELLKKNARMQIPVASLNKRSESQKEGDHQAYEKALELLQAGKLLTPADF